MERDGMFDLGVTPEAVGLSVVGEGVRIIFSGDDKLDVCRWLVGGFEWVLNTEKNLFWKGIFVN